MSSTSRLTTTGYAVLGLLSLGDWTAYELAKLMERSVGLILPRAPSVIYEEPKKLARHGLVKASSISRGQRQVALYHLTSRGGTELARWTRETAGVPSLDAEVIVKALFAQTADLASLQQQMGSLSSSAQAQLELLREQSGGYLVDDGPFPERLPIIALTGRFVADYYLFLAHWAQWAQEQLAHRPFDKQWALEVLADTHHELSLRTAE